MQDPVTKNQPTKEQVTKEQAIKDLSTKDWELKVLLLQSKFLKSKEQCLAIVDDLARRSSAFRELYLNCRDGRCRRRRACVGPDLSCIRDCPLPPATKRETRRLKRDFRRAPTRW